jgi:hypothetical protein
MVRLSITGILIILLVATTLCSAVSANPIIHHATIVYFEKDNQSVDTSITYSLDCFGHRCKKWDCSAPEDQKDPAEYTQEPLLHNSGICPPSYGCIISEDTETGRNVGFHIDSCTISGEVYGQTIAIDNYSDPRYGCFLTMFKDGDGGLYTDFCEMFISLPPELDIPLKRIDSMNSIRSDNHLKFYRDVHMK